MTNNKIKVLNFFKNVFIIILVLLSFLPMVAYSQSNREHKVDKLTLKLKDKDPSVRKKAAKALGEMKDARAVEPLIAALKDEIQNVQRKPALPALTKRPSDDPLVTLEDQYGVRREIKQALGKMGVSAVGPLIAALKDDDRFVSHEVALALGEVGVPAVAPLIAALKDGKFTVRHNAAQALGSIGKPAADPLIATLNDKNSEVRKEAAWALGKIKDSRAVNPLVATINDGNRYVRSSVVWALGEIKDSGAVSSLISTLKDKDLEVRQEAVWALGKIKDSQAVEPLIATLSEKDSNIPWYAAWALGNIGTPAVAPLIAVLKEKDIEVRKYAARALGEIKDTRASEALVTAMKNRQLEIVSGAYAFFIRRGEPGTESILIEALNKYCLPFMPEDFLNCGNDELQAGARRWAKEHGYIVFTSRGKAGSLKWKSHR